MHKKRMAEFIKNKAQELLPPLTKALDENQRIFFEKTRMSGSNTTREITKVIRLREKNKEYFTYNQQLRSHDNLNNELECYMPDIGSYEKPYFETVTDPSTGAKIPTGIRREEKIFELEWPKDWTPDLERDIIDKVDLIVIAQGRKYGGYDFQTFKDRTFDELVTIGKYGVLHPSPKIIDTEDQRLREADKEKRKR